MSKYLELVGGSFNESHFNKQTSQYPYVAYSIKDDNFIYSIAPESIVYDPYVTFTAEEANSTIGLNKLSSYQTLEYSINTSDWTSMSISTNITLDNIGDKVYVRGVLSKNNSSTKYTQFKMTGKIAAYGNCNALWNYNDLNAPLKKYCGYIMFYNCKSLTKAPELPATTLADSCYYWMFYGCKSLIQAPELPATTLAYGCYFNMFQNCSNLNYIKCLATDISATDFTTDWVTGVALTGTFVKNPSTSWTIGTSGIPAGWTVENAVL